MQPRGSLLADVSPSGAQTWTVRFRKFTVSVLRRVPLRSRPAAYAGEWTHTYVDATTRIMRTRREGGGGEFLFILRRQA